MSFPSRKKKFRDNFYRILSLFLLPLVTTLLYFLTPLKSNLLKEPSYIVYENMSNPQIFFTKKDTVMQQEIIECIQNIPKVNVIKFSAVGPEPSNGMLEINVQDGDFIKLDNNKICDIRLSNEVCKENESSNKKIIIELSNFTRGKVSEVYFKTLPYNAKVTMFPLDEKTLKDVKPENDIGLYYFWGLAFVIWIVQVSLQFSPKGSTEEELEKIKRNLH